MARLGSALGRLSQREKVLIGLMLGLIFLIAVAAVQFFLSGSIDELEEKIEADQKALLQIHAQAGSYLDAVARTNKMKRLAARNRDLNLKLSINEIAKRISYESYDRRGNPAGQKRLSDVIQYQQTQETFLSIRKKKKVKRTKDKKDSDVGYYRRDQKVSLSDTVPFTAIYDFLEKVEAAESMLFVTDMELRRDFRLGELASRNAMFTVSTYYYKGKEEEMPAEAAAEGEEEKSE